MENDIDYTDVVPWDNNDKDVGPAPDFDIEKYAQFLADLDKEWPPQRIRDYLLDRARKSYRFFKKKAERLEAENAEARRKGVSYEKRKACSKSIETLQRMAGETAEHGRVLKQSELLSVRYYLQPDEMPLIKEKGFEWHLRLYSV